MTPRDYSTIRAAIETCVYFQTDIDDLVNLIKTECKENGLIPLSVILGCSHMFCKNCCDLYTPCHVGEWINSNPELYDSEVFLFRDILDECSEDILVDITPYTFDEVNTFNFVSELNHTDKLAQLYTVILEV